MRVYHIRILLKITNFNTWVSNVLGHGDLLTSFSYSWVNVADPREMVEEGLKTELDELRQKIDMCLNVKGVNEGEDIEDDGNNGKYKPLGKKGSREDKFELLNKIYNDHGGVITNAALRKISGIGAIIVNEFIKAKKEGKTETTEATEPTEATETKQTETAKEPAGFKLIGDDCKKQPIRKSARLKNKVKK